MMTSPDVINNNSGVRTMMTKTIIWLKLLVAVMLLVVVLISVWMRLQAGVITPIWNHQNPEARKSYNVTSLLETETTAWLMDVT